MLTRLQRGLSMVELMVGMAIIAILAMIGAPNMLQWMQNAQVRGAAESIQNGLQLARAEAVRRNTQVRFQLTSSADSGCAVAGDGTATAANWVISIDDPSGNCGANPSDDTAPRIIQTKPATEGTANVQVIADQATLIFNATGRLTPVPAAAIDIDISNPLGGACIHSGGTTRCLRIVVTQGGQARMCDPLRSSTDPMGC